MSTSPERPGSTRGEELWEAHSQEFRDPLRVAMQWEESGELDPALLRSRVRGPFWDLLAELKLTLMVTREYEHLLVALDGTAPARRRQTHLRLPHPNGMAWDSRRRVLHVGSTRNPNMVFGFQPVSGAAPNAQPNPEVHGTLVPSGARYLPGALYLHDLALVGGALHANAVGMNAIVELPEAGGFKPVWWPKTIGPARGGTPKFEKNYLQLNSIAPADSLRDSAFSASVEHPGSRRPGHLNFPVDRRGVVFSGKTREVLARGLTRPHSTRFHRRSLYVNDSGYGRLCVIDGGRADTVAELPGWTRGAFFAGRYAFVATSRVIPKYSHYAPGLDPSRSTCGVHILELASGRRLASLTWPLGNQLFAVEGVPRAVVSGLPFGAGRSKAVREVFYGATVG